MYSKRVMLIRDTVIWITIAVSAIMCIAGLAACSQTDNRVTQELIYPASESAPPEIVVRWPAFVQPGDVFTGISSDGRTISTAPLPAPTPIVTPGE